MKLNSLEWMLAIGLLLPDGKIAGATFVYSYDALHRLTNAAYSDGSHELYTYDSVGNRLSWATSTATANVDGVAPSIPINLQVTSFTPSKLSIDWNGSIDTGGSGLAGYAVFANNIEIATTTQTNYTLLGLLPNTQYCLSVAAFDRAANLSLPSTNLCQCTPIFQTPILTTTATNGEIQIEIVNGTPGPYDLFASSNLFQWNFYTNIFVPDEGSLLILPIGPTSQQFYQFRWSTNAENVPQMQ